MRINSVTNDNGIYIEIGSVVQAQYKSPKGNITYDKAYIVKNIYFTMNICDNGENRVACMAEGDNGGSDINNLVVIKV